MGGMMKVKLSTKYLPEGWYDLVNRGVYADGSPALELWHDGQRDMRCTVCVGTHKPAERNVLIKDWSENEGLLKALTDAEVIEKVPVKVFRSHFVDVFECRLTDKALAGLGVLV